MFLVWHAMCVDNFTASYRSLTVQAVGAVGAKAESLKDEKYSDLFHLHEFVPAAMESFGVFGLCLLAFVKELGRKLRYQTREEKEATYLIQCLSIAVQRDSAIPLWEAWAVSAVLELSIVMFCLTYNCSTDVYKMLI